MAFFMLKAKNIVIDQDTMLKLSELLEGSVIVAQDWRTKSFEVDTDYENNGVSFAPFSSAQYAAMMLRHQEKISQDK